MIRLRSPHTARHKPIADDRDCEPVARGKYRVLMLLEDWNAGGTEQYVAALTRYLKRHENCEVHLGLVRRAKNCRTKSLPIVSQESKPDHLQNMFAGVYDFRLTHIRSLRRLIAELDPDVCHCHLYSNLLPATFALRACRVRRLITTLHMPLDAWSWRHRMMWRMATGLADHVVCSSRTIARTIGGDRGRRGGRVSVISPPVPDVPLARWNSSDRRASAFTVCGCGRLAAEKDWPTLLQAFAAMEPIVRRSSRLVLLGGGPMERELRALASRLGIVGSLEMSGFVETAEVVATLRRSDVFVLPSRFEGLGMAAIEAMQCGVPTITADYEASGEYIEHGVTGHRFPRGDVSALTDLLIWHNDHPDESRTVGQCGRELVGKEYSEEATFACQMSAYLGEPYGTR